MSKAYLASAKPLSVPALRAVPGSTARLKIAEKDLELRGPGEFVGTRQSGMPEFLFGNIVRDRDMLEKARADAESYFRSAGEVGGFEPGTLEQLADWWKRRYGLYQVG